jgi:hypothetical protein
MSEKEDDMFKINITNIGHENIEGIKDQLFIDYGNFGYDFVESLLPLKLFLIMK